jgi:hypothetical protein
VTDGDRPSRRSGGPSLLLLASGGLLTVALAAPWGYADDSFAVTTADATVSGWEWFDTAARAVLVATVAAIVAVAVRRPRLGLARAILAVALVAGTLVVLTGLGDKRIATEWLGEVTPLRFSSALGSGPAVALMGLVLLAAALAGVRARAPAGARSFALLVAAAVLAGSTFLRWSWTASDNRADAWSLYEWADVGVVVLAAAIALMAAARPRRALLAIPLAAVTLPFLDRGVDPSGPGGFHEPIAHGGSPVGAGVVVAVGALVLVALVAARGSKRVSQRRGFPLRKEGG